MKTIFVIVFVLASIKATQTDTVYVEVGNYIINADFFEDYTNEWSVSYFSPQKKLTGKGKWTDFVTVVSENNQRYLHRLQELYNQKGSLINVWTNIAELPDLKPVYTTEFTTRGRFNYIEFKPGSVSGSWSGAEKEINVSNFDLKLDRPVFDWSLYGILLAALPFEKSKTYKLPIFDGIGSSDPVGFLIVDVRGKKQIGSYQTWEMKTNQNLVFWVTKQKPYVINLELSRPNGSSVLWESVHGSK